MHLTSVLVGVLATYLCLLVLPIHHQHALLAPFNAIRGLQQHEELGRTAYAGFSESSSGSSSSIDSSAGGSGGSSSRSLLSSLTSMGRQLLYQGGNMSPVWRQEYSSYKSRWHHTVLDSVFKAQQKLSSSPQERASRMFVPMLSNRHAELCCMLTDLNIKVGATTPLDVFIFTVENKAEKLYNRSPCWRRKFNITVNFLPLNEHWGADPRGSSSAVHDANSWIGMPGLFGENYRKMGHWRLAFQFAFADMLGYKYIWQLDDDSYFRTAVGFNMIDYMKQNDLWVAGVKTLPDPHWVTWGLAEIARLFLVAERLAPPGTLFSNHTEPSGLDGLYTVRNDPVRTGHPLTGDTGGWSKTIIHGSCMIMDMDKFWWPKHVQRFVELVLQTGYHWRFRWNEQGVMAMVWQMFVPEGHFQFNTLPLDYMHPRKVWGECPHP